MSTWPLTRPSFENDDQDLQFGVAPGSGKTVGLPRPRMLGGLALTKPGIQYDPTTDDLGQITAPPRISFFPNKQARDTQLLSDENAQVAKSAVPNMVGRQPVMSVPQGMNPVQPSFADAMHDPTTGLPRPINPSETKLGKLFHLAISAGTGAMSAYGATSPAQGQEMAREAQILPLQRMMAAQQLRQQQAQTGLLQAEQQSIDIPGVGRVPTWLAKTMGPAWLHMQGTLGAAGIGAGSREDVAKINQGMALPVPELMANLAGVPEMAGKPATKATMGNLARMVQAQGYQFRDLGDEGTWLLDRTGNRLGRIGDSASMAAYAPTVTSKKESTDLMGNTSSTSTSQKVPPSIGGSPAPLPMPAGEPRNFVQPTAGGPLVPQGNGTPARQAGTPKPAATAQQSQLPDDVEQRLAGSGLNGQQQSYIRALLNYSGQMPSPRAKNYAETLATLKQIDPSFDAYQYDVRRKTELDYAPGGSVGKQVLAFNTAIRHMGMLKDAADKLNTGQIQLANRIVQGLKLQFGNDAQSNFDTIKTYLDGELAKGFGGGVATDSSRAEAAAILSKVQSPQQINGGITSAADLLQGKIGAQADAYKNAMGGRSKKLLDDESMRTLQRLGVGGGSGGVQVVDPRGVVHTFRDQRSADTFRASARIQ